MINIIIPMAGDGSRFINAGYKTSKPFIDILGKAMIQRVIENLAYKDAHYILIMRKENLMKNKSLLDNIKKKYNISFIYIDKLTEGAACTVLFAHRLINNNNPLLIANSDQIIDIDIKDFIDDALSRKLNGSILTFEAHDDKWSYAKIDNNNLVVEVKEKEVISNHATVGIYFYTQGSSFVNSAIDMIINNERVNNEFYVCPVYNYLIKQKQKIGIYNIKKSQMHGVGTPSDLDKYIRLIKNSSL